jgi:hypothetical protein
LFLTKTFKEKNKRCVPNFFKNAMIKNIKIHNILDIIGILKSMKPNKYIRKK